MGITFKENLNDVRNSKVPEIYESLEEEGLKVEVYDPLADPELVKKGSLESEFCRLILKEFTRDRTCVSGFNNIRFDDEIIRRLLYRNLRDPYAREWHGGNCRWDLIDPMRAAYALRPDGIEWPKKEDGSVSFRLEDLARANNVLHENAHDALSDVRATIGVARVLKKAQPKLFDFSLTLRKKLNVSSILDPKKRQPAVLVSTKLKRWKKNLGLIVPLTYHPLKANNIICYDLSCNPHFIHESSDESLLEDLKSDHSFKKEGALWFKSTKFGDDKDLSLIHI